MPQRAFVQLLREPACLVLLGMRSSLVTLYFVVKSSAIFSKFAIDNSADVIFCRRHFATF